MSYAPIKPFRAIHSLICNYQSGASLASKSSRTGVILGNGPSLGKDIETLLSLHNQKLDYWCVNAFANTVLYERIKPQFYVLADPSFWTSKVSPEVLKMCSDLIDTLKNKTTWPMTVYLPLEAKKTDLPDRLSTPTLNIRFFNTTIFHSTSDTLNTWIYCRLLGMPQCQNVLVGALFLAIVSKYERIYLFGADHSWIQNIEVTAENVVLLNEAHFYDEKTSRPIRGQGLGKTWSLSHILHIYSIIFKQYEILGKFAQNLGIKVVNGSSYSLIDAFERQSVDAIHAQLVEPQNPN